MKDRYRCTEITTETSEVAAKFKWSLTDSLEGGGAVRLQDGIGYTLFLAEVFHTHQMQPHSKDIIHFQLRARMPISTAWM